MANNWNKCSIIIIVATALLGSYAQNQAATCWKVCLPDYSCSPAEGAIFTDNMIDGEGFIDPSFSAESCSQTEEFCCPTESTKPTSSNDHVCWKVCLPYYTCLPAADAIFTNNMITRDGFINQSFSEEHCKETEDSCCGRPHVTTIKEIRCGVRNYGVLDPSAGIASEFEAEYGEFPWLAAILKSSDNSMLCGGALIHPSVVLSAAHCFFDKASMTLLPASSFKARLGEWDTQSLQEPAPHQDRAPAALLLHPAFNVRQLAYDAALMVLDSPVTIAPNVNTICLPRPSKTFNNAKDCINAGWGKMDFGDASKNSVRMKKTYLDVVKRAECQESFRKAKRSPRFRLHDSFVCAGGKLGDDACTGDGGSPLFCASSSERYEVAGLVSWGVKCGTKDLPGAYARVALTRQWVDAEFTKAGLETSTYTMA